MVQTRCRIGPVASIAADLLLAGVPAVTTRPVLRVETNHGEETDASGQDWEVRLRRGRRRVVLQHGVGHFSAIALVAEVQTHLARTGS